MIDYTKNQECGSNPNGFEKAKAGGQKKKKKNERTKVKSKHYTKHYLYCVLCCRFNATQRVYCRQMTAISLKLKGNDKVDK